MIADIRNKEQRVLFETLISTGQLLPFYIATPVSIINRPLKMRTRSQRKVDVSSYTVYSLRSDLIQFAGEFPWWNSIR